MQLNQLIRTIQLIEVSSIDFEQIVQNRFEDNGFVVDRASSNSLAQSLAQLSNRGMLIPFSVKARGNATCFCAGIACVDNDSISQFKRILDNEFVCVSWANAPAFAIATRQTTSSKVSTDDETLEKGQAALRILTDRVDVSFGVFHPLRSHSLWQISWAIFCCGWNVALGFTRLAVSTWISAWH